jgi:beta-carotene 15,15'-dioxygenase
VPFALRSAFPWLFAILLGLSGLFFPRISNQFAPWFFLSSALLLGVPHGACDPWVPGWVRHHPSRLPFLIIFFIIYLSLSFLYLLIWRAFPLPSTIFFLCLTAWHWGTADASLEFSPSFRWLIFGFGRGALVMLAPFAFHLTETWQVILLLAPQAGPQPTLPFFQLLIFAILLNLISDFTAQNWIETGLLTLLFFFCPPLLSVGTYFVVFHAWRHLLRLASLAFLRWIPPFLSSSFPSGQNWVGPYLILLAVLTLPHAILVAWMDKETLRS